MRSKYSLLLFPKYPAGRACGLHAVQLAHGGGKLLQKLLLGGCEVFGNLHIDGDELIAPAAAAKIGDALSADAEDRAGGSALGDVHFHLAVKGRNLKLRAQNSLCVGNILLQQHAVALALEAGVGTDADGHQKLARRTAVCTGVTLAPDGHGLPVVYAGGDIDLLLYLTADSACATAVFAGLMDYLARAAAS